MHAGMTVSAPDLERAALVRLLSIGFTAPTPTTTHELRVLAEALAAAAEPDTGIGALAAALADDAAVSDLPFAHEELFGGAVTCPPYEGSYERDPFRGTRQMADAAGFYAAFGAVAEGPAGERPDHIACELEFLAFLAARRLAAQESGDGELDERCAAAEDAFIREHLGRFMGGFCRTVEETAGSPVYRALGRLGGEFIDAELAARGLVPPPLRRPVPSGVEGDEVVCGGGGCPAAGLGGASACAHHTAGTHGK